MECRSTSANTAMNAKVNQVITITGNFFIKNRNFLKDQFHFKKLSAIYKCVKSLQGFNSGIIY